MLYGYKDEGRTIVTAHKSNPDFEAWYAAALQGKNFTEVRETDVMDVLTNEQFYKLEHSVYIFSHADEAQATAFADEHQLILINHVRAIDRHIDMVNYTRPDEYVATTDDRTIEEIHDLIQNDHWDKRTDEEKEQDLAMKEIMNKLKEEHKLSSDSFSPKPKPDLTKDSIWVDEIRVGVDADGNAKIDNVLAVKSNKNQIEAEKNGEEIPEADFRASNPRQRQVDNNDTGT